MSADSLRQQLAAREAAPAASGPTVYDLIERVKPQLARALPAQMSADRLARVILTEVRRTPQLAECTGDSLLGACLTAAQLGLEPGPLQQVYLIPRWNGRAKVREVQLMVGYRGMIDLAMRGGRTLSVDAHVVRERDTFDFQYGTEPHLNHVPALTDPGDVVCAYAVAKLREGGAPFVVLSLADIDERRKRGGDSDRSPWVTDFDAMARKSCVRALAPYLPQSAEFALAQHVDESVRTDLGQLEDFEPDREPIVVPNEADQIEGGGDPDTTSAEGDGSEPSSGSPDDATPEPPARGRKKNAEPEQCATCANPVTQHEDGCPEAPGA